MAEDALIVRGAREHNLRNIDVTIPRDRLTVKRVPSSSFSTWSTIASRLWPAIGAVLLALAAAVAVIAVMRWERTHLSVTGSAFVIEHGFLSRRTASISLNGTVFEVERTLLGRILGYGTVIAGELEIDWVPRRITRLLQKRR